MRNTRCATCEDVMSLPDTGYVYSELLWSLEDAGKCFNYKWAVSLSFTTVRTLNTLSTYIPQPPVHRDSG